MMGEQVSVVGAGGWGTAIAKLLAEQGHRVTLWARSPERAERLRHTRENETYLPGHKLPSHVEVTHHLEEAARSRWLVLCVPSQHLRAIWKRLATHLDGECSLLNTAKGLEVETGLRLSQVLESGSPAGVPVSLAVLSGPNHAEEVAKGLPTTSVVASRRPEVAEAWQSLLMAPMFRVYTSDDLIGVELGGALKNVIALAAGMADGLGFGDNTKAALITRGLAEILRLGTALGAQPLTFSGLSGMGDLIATSTSPHSRNARAGRLIGQGHSIDEVLSSSPMAVEGVPTSKAALRLAAAHGVEMPITAAVVAVLSERLSPAEAVRELMGRGPKSELHALYP